MIFLLFAQFQVVVLALAGLVSAVPEADPQLLLNSAFPAAPLATPFGLNPFFAPRVAAPLVHSVPAPVVAPVAPAVAPIAATTTVVQSVS